MTDPPRAYARSGSRTRHQLHWPGDDSGVGIVVSQDLLETGAILGHGFGTGLTKSHTVALADAGEDQRVAIFRFGEIVTGHRGPAKRAYDVEASRFIKRMQLRCGRGGDVGGPANRVSAAVWAFNDIIRIVD